MVCLDPWRARLHVASDPQHRREDLHHHVGRDRPGLHPPRRPHLCRLHRRHPDLLHRVWAGELNSLTTVPDDQMRCNDAQQKGKGINFSKI